jgi:cobalt-zinc-cadmium efflux system outer membrane protein
MRALALILVAAGTVQAEELTPSAAMDLRALVRLISGRSPILQERSLMVDLAAAELRQSHLLENPTLDTGVGAIPLGETTPPGLSPSQVINYGVGLAYRFELGKRGPRQARARFLLDGVRAQLQSAARLEALHLARSLGGLAATALRIEGTHGLLESARGSLAVARSRVQSGFGAALEVDRMEIEVLRFEQQVRSHEGELSAQQSECASVVGMRCHRFPSIDEARRFLAEWSRAAAESNPRVEDRADLRALASFADAARHEARLARAQGIPDPTLRVGYLYDSFVVAGNQRSSLNLSLSLPLPIFDHGQAQLEAARARQSRSQLERERLLQAATAEIAALQKNLAFQLERNLILEEQTLPRARSVLASLVKAAEVRAVPLSDVIQARRALGELLMAEADSLLDAFNAAVALLEQLPSRGE